MYNSTGTDSVVEARAAIHRVLRGITSTPEAAEECGGDQSEPASTAILRDAFHGDLATGLLALAGEVLAFRCDGGTLTVLQER